MPIRNETMSNALTAALEPAGPKQRVSRDSPPTRNAKVLRSFRPRTAPTPKAIVVVPTHKEQSDPPPSAPVPEVLENPEPDIEQELPAAIAAASPESGLAQALVQSPAEEAEPKVSALPEELKWLERPSPFNSDLFGIVNRLRDALTFLAFSITEAEARRETKQRACDAAGASLNAELENITQLRDKIRKIEEQIATYAMAAELSTDPEIVELLSAKRHHHHHTNGHIQRAPDDPTVCRLKDVRRFFEAHPGTNWNTKEIMRQLPAGKQAHARKYLTQHLHLLAKEGSVRRISTGVYRTA